MHCVHFFFTDGTDGKGFQLVMRGLLRQVSRSGNVITFQLAFGQQDLEIQQTVNESQCWLLEYGHDFSFWRDFAWLYFNAPHQLVADQRQSLLTADMRLKLNSGSSVGRATLVICSVK